MAAYLITYDLNKETNRPPLLKGIKDTFDSWAKLSESSYAVVSQSSPKSIYDGLKAHLDSNDSLYVIKLSKPYFGQGAEDVNNWLENNLPSE